MLHHALPVAGKPHNRYCGPAALAALTGISTGEAARELREASGKRSIRGCPEHAMVKCLERSGWQVAGTEDYYPQRLMSFRRWLANHYQGNTCLVVASRHYWAISDGYYVDSFMRKPNPISEVHMPKCQVHTVYHLEGA